jgi:hypothetical protein
MEQTRQQNRQQFSHQLSDQFSDQLSHPPRQKRTPSAFGLARAAGAVLVMLGASSATAFAQAASPAQPSAKTLQAQATPQNDSPMIKPPEAASGSTGSSNPDNMPIKRPGKPTNDRMTHEPPASGANAK